MDKTALFSLLKQLNLPPHDWVVFGGACLTAHGIRATTDLELFVKPYLYASLHQSGWMEKITKSTSATYVTKHYNGIPVLAFVTCGSDAWKPDTTSYLKTPEYIKGMPFMPLAEMYAWKAFTARPKDLDDLLLIDTYLGSRNSTAHEQYNK